jgi:hypothetical protein
MAGIDLRSPSFGDHQPIPARHAKNHDNLSPALEWLGVPEEAVELADAGAPVPAVEGRNDFGEEATAARCRRSATPRTGTSSRSMPRRRRWG